MNGWCDVKKKNEDKTKEPAFGAEDFSAEVSVEVAPLDSPEPPAGASVPNDCFVEGGRIWRRRHEPIGPNGSWKDWNELA